MISLHQLTLKADRFGSIYESLSMLSPIIQLYPACSSAYELDDDAIIHTDL